MNELVKKYSLVVGLIIFFFIFVAFYSLLYINNQNQFSILAQSFIEGKTNFSEQLYDSAVFNGKYYWPLGPFPAILLMPMALIGRFFNIFPYQAFLQIPLGWCIFFVCFKISKLLKYPTIDSLYWAFALCFSTSLIGVLFVTESWYFSQVICFLLALLLILEHSTKKRYWLMGLLVGLLLATRVTAAIPAFLFVFLSMIFLPKITKNNSQNTLVSKKNQLLHALKNCFSKESLSKIIQLLVPLTIIIILLSIYNYVRFNNFSEFGYTKQVIVSTESLVVARNYGVFSLLHIPGNIYYSLLSMPLPIFKDGISHVLKFPFIAMNPWGMSVFVTSPYLFYLFLIKYKDRLSKILLIVIIIGLIPIFTYFGIGFKQFGYRYFLDVMPFVFLLLITGYSLKNRVLSRGFKSLIVVSAFLNLYMLFFFYLPHII